MLYVGVAKLRVERSPIKDVEIKVLLRDALTDKVNDRLVYMKGIDASYHYEKATASIGRRIWRCSSLILGGLYAHHAGVCGE